MTDTLSPLNSNTDSIPAPTTSPDPLLTPNKATHRVNSRLQVLADLIRQEGGRLPTHRAFLERLRVLGVKTSKGTVGNDLAELGLSGVQRRGRRSKGTGEAVPEALVRILDGGIHVGDEREMRHAKCPQMTTPPDDLRP